jgi:hypothetical protein
MCAFQKGLGSARPHLQGYTAQFRHQLGLEFQLGDKTVLPTSAHRKEEAPRMYTTAAALAASCSMGGRGVHTTPSLSDPWPASWPGTSPPAGHAPGANGPPPTEGGGGVVRSFERVKKKKKQSRTSHLASLQLLALDRILLCPSVSSSLSLLPCPDTESLYNPGANRFLLRQYTQ